MRATDGHIIPLHGVDLHPIHLGVGISPHQQKIPAGVWIWPNLRPGRKASRPVWNEERVYPRVLEVYGASRAGRGLDPWEHVQDLERPDGG
jgi:hypothetical protein